MNEEPGLHRGETRAADPPPGPLEAGTGAALRASRLRQGLSVAEVAADTRINPAYLEAMEAERWELLPAPVYARGFLRGYARYLRFDEDDIERMVPRNLPRPHDLEPAPGLRRSSSQLSLALPSFGWFKHEARLPAEERARATAARPAPPTRSTAPRPSSAPRRATFGPAPSSPLRALLQQADVPGLLARFRADPVMGSTVVGAVLLVVMLGGYLWVGRDTEPPPAVQGTSVAKSSPQRQIAGPEPTTAAQSAPPAVATPASPRDGAMPDLVGLTRRDAEDELGRLGLAFVVIEVATPTATPGTVYNQSPQAGKEVKRGDSVTLLVARAP